MEHAVWQPVERAFSKSLLVLLDKPQIPTATSKGGPSITVGHLQRLVRAVDVWNGIIDRLPDGPIDHEALVIESVVMHLQTVLLKMKALVPEM
ncbi:hypothetical protein ASE72_14475 [Sphingomonas sp. Leaf20]|nr:hypothetical protein ASE72_14475 [Sphingomonas sp. Leaf20]